MNEMNPVGCPKCGAIDGLVLVDGRPHFICDTHRCCWWVGKGARYDTNGYERVDQPGALPAAPEQAA